MATSFLSRKPDSGLGNIRSSPASPSRNIDWVLLVAQLTMTVIGFFIVFSASRTRVTIDPYVFATRQVVFAIVGIVAMFVVMTLDYETSARPRPVPVRRHARAARDARAARHRVREDRISFDLGPFNFQPAEFAKFTSLLMFATYLSEDRRDGIDYPRFLGGLLIVGAPSC